MNIETQLIEVVERVINSADFISGELPGYVQELLLWAAVDAAAGVLIFGAITAAAIYAIPFCRKKYAENPRDDEWVGFGIPISVVAGTISGFAAIYNVMQVVKIWIAPKVYLVEYAASLMS